MIQVSSPLLYIDLSVIIPSVYFALIAGQHYMRYKANKRNKIPYFMPSKAPLSK